MACYTMGVLLEDSAANRKARERLGLPLEGELSRVDAARVRVEAGAIRVQGEMRRLDPRAIVRRRGNKLSITVQR